MSDIPPADWYTDPEDDRQYRYWDGESWTEHRAPRRLGNKPRPTGRLISDSVSMIRRRWRVYAVVIAVGAVIAAAIFEVGYRLGLGAVDQVFGGRLDEIITRFSSPDFDPTTEEGREYIDSIRIDLSWRAAGQAALGALIILFASLPGLAAVARAAVADLLGRVPTTGDALQDGLARLGRVAGVWLQIMGAMAAMPVVMAAIVVWSAGSYILFLLFIPMLIATVAFFIVAFPVMTLAPVTAAVAPKTPSLRHTISLVRGVFWAAFGRLFLITLLALVLAAAITLPMLAIPGDSLIHDMASGTLANAVVLAAIVPTVLVYRDLGGEIATDP